MTEKQAVEVMERARDSGSPLPNIVEYSEALRKTYEVLGSNYTEEQLHNWILCGKYPFLIPRYDWSGEIIKNYDYTSTYLDDIPVGWKIAFGEMMCEEIKQELIRCNYLDEFRIIQAKEKFGGLRIYTNGEPVDCKVQQIIDKYSTLSENICVICGKPDVPITNNGGLVLIVRNVLPHQTIGIKENTLKKLKDGLNLEQKTGKNTTMRVTIKWLILIPLKVGLKNMATK